jgi:hypothetical protein
LDGLKRGEVISDSELLNAILIPWSQELGTFTVKTLQAMDGRVGAERRLCPKTAETLNKQFDAYYAEPLSAQLSALRRSAARGWRDEQGAFEEALHQRCYVLSAEHDAARAARAYSLAAALRRLEETTEQGVKTRYSRELAEQFAAHDALTLIEDARISRLKTLAEGIKLPTAVRIKSFAIELT